MVPGFYSARWGASMNRTKAVILASTALCMSLGFAQTADAQGRPISWTGFYVGANAGYSWGTAGTATADVAPFTQTTPFNFIFPGGGSAISLGRVKGGIFGGQIGYNWQFSPSWLYGVEADLQWSGQKASGSGSFSGFIDTGFPDCSATTCVFTNNTDVTAKLSWFGTARGRVGVMSNNMLFYGTGGLAFGKVSVSGTNTFVVEGITGAGIVTYSTPFSYSKTKTGWTLGAGIEGGIGMSNWTWKVEYLHIDLGSIGGGGGSVVTVNSFKFTDEIVRFGLNYRFAGGP